MSRLYSPESQLRSVNARFEWRVSSNLPSSIIDQSWPRWLPYFSEKATSTGFHPFETKKPGRRWTTPGSNNPLTPFVPGFIWILNPGRRPLGVWIESCRIHFKCLHLRQFFLLLFPPLSPLLRIPLPRSFNSAV